MSKAISPHEWLYRRGFKDKPSKFLNPDGTATSRVFKLRDKDNGELSVDIASLTTPEISIKDPTKHMLFEILNESVLQIGLNTYHKPDLINNNDAHAVIVGMTLDDEITPGLLAKKSKIVFI